MSIIKRYLLPKVRLVGMINNKSLPLSLPLLSVRASSLTVKWLIEEKSSDWLSVSTLNSQMLSDRKWKAWLELIAIGILAVWLVGVTNRNSWLTIILTIIRPAESQPQLEKFSDLTGANMEPGPGGASHFNRRLSQVWAESYLVRWHGTHVIALILSLMAILYHLYHCSTSLSLLVVESSNMNKCV